MLEIRLEFGVGGARRMRFAPIRGADERAADGDPLVLLTRLAAAATGTVGGGEVPLMTVGDRDRALAALYGHVHGDRVVADAICAECTKRYEIGFRFSDLIRRMAPDGSATGDPPAVRVAGSVIRLPRVADLGGTPEDMLAALLVEGSMPDAEVVEAAIGSADPALELDLSGTCPECSAEQRVPFSMVGFFSAALARDSEFLMRETHLLARAYGWSFGEIMELTRSERQGFVRLVLAEHDAGAPRRRLAS